MAKMWNLRELILSKVRERDLSHGSRTTLRELETSTEPLRIRFRTAPYARDPSGTTAICMALYMYP